MFYNNPTTQMNYMQPHQEIVRVNGRNGAESYPLGPNSSALLLDEQAPLVWLCQTDGAGYKTVTPYSVTPYVPEPEPNVKDIMARLDALEKKLEKTYEGGENGNGYSKSYPTKIKQQRTDDNTAGNV